MTTVYLVGAGPGDPELITVKGQRLLAEADSILYDELANPALLAVAPATAERIYVGKRSGSHAATQDQIAHWMIQRARRGLRVVRLKGGDPFLFGRGGEEVAALAAAGVPCEVVPGISAANGATAAAGIPLTQRGVASSVRLLSGHGESPAPAYNKSETLVYFMGLARVPDIARDLRAQGWPAATPAAVIERGTLPGQRVVAGSLNKIARQVRNARITSPALLVVGAVARAHKVRPQLTVVPPPPSGLILMAHGSPLPAWQRGVHKLARELGGRAAFLPPVAPSLGDAIAEAVACGDRRLIVVPYFLAPGLHVTRDIPDLIEAERARFPEVSITLSACLEGHAALRTAVLARLAETTSSTPINAVKSKDGSLGCGVVAGGSRVRARSESAR
ncbi:MAG TPA: uroporphyrinogen-III C-methyltransferase [Terriglobales bacterium]|nr:uroporphyrinogen-III C-methyltransferase [Terriglobales bacterium]